MQIQYYSEGKSDIELSYMLVKICGSHREYTHSVTSNHNNKYKCMCTYYNVIILGDQLYINAVSTNYIDTFFFFYNSLNSFQ